MQSTMHFLNSISKMMDDQDKYQISDLQVRFLTKCHNTLSTGDELSIEEQISLLDLINHTLCRVEPAEPICSFDFKDLPVN